MAKTIIKFKQTEIGEIPADWDVASIGSKYIFTAKPRDKKLSDYENIPFLPMNMVPFHGRTISNYVLKPPMKISSGTYFEEGDLLVSKITPCFENGKQGLVSSVPQGFGVATTEVIPIKAIRDVSDIKFLSFYLLETDTRRLLAGKMQGATGRQRLDKTLVELWQIPFPPLPEQEKIADVLSKIQKAVENQEKIVSDLRELKAATIAKLFREGLRGEPLKQTEIGEVPGSWQIKALTACCEKPQYGYTESSSEKPIGPKFLRITDLTENGVDWDDVPYCKCSEDGFVKYQLKSGDILVARIGATTGKNHLIVNCPKAVFASYLIRLRAKPGLIPEFLSNFMDSDIYWKQVRATKGQNLKGGMSGAILSQILMPFPSEPEQKEISNTIEIIDRNTRHAVGKHLHAKVLFSSTLDQLMTGKVRV